MSDQYTVLAKEGFEVCLNERSNIFHVMLRASDEADTRHIHAWAGPQLRSGMATAGAYSIVDLTPEDLVTMAVEIIRVASIWVEDGPKLVEDAALKVMDL